MRSNATPQWLEDALEKYVQHEDWYGAERDYRDELEAAEQAEWKAKQAEREDMARMMGEVAGDVVNRALANFGGDYR